MSNYKIMGITGNRPEKITSRSEEEVYKRLEIIIEKFKNSGGEILIQGGARGVDLWCAWLAVKHNLEVWSYLPHERQEKSWSDKDKKVYKMILSKSSKITYAGEEFSNKNFFIRNKAIIDDCDILLATHDEAIEDGGAIDTMNKAIKAGKPVIENIIGNPCKIINHNISK